jgi:hypothetical protein
MTNSIKLRVELMKMKCLEAIIYPNRYFLHEVPDVTQNYDKIIYVWKQIRGEDRYEFHATLYKDKRRNESETD